MDTYPTQIASPMFKIVEGFFLKQVIFTNTSSGDDLPDLGRTLGGEIYSQEISPALPHPWPTEE